MQFADDTRHELHSTYSAIQTEKTAEVWNLSFAVGHLAWSIGALLELTSSNLNNILYLSHVSQLIIESREKWGKKFVIIISDPSIIYGSK